MLNFVLDIALRKKKNHVFGLLIYGVWVEVLLWVSCDFLSSLLCLALICIPICLIFHVVGILVAIIIAINVVDTVLVILLSLGFDVVAVSWNPDLRVLVYAVSFGQERNQ